MLKLESSQVLQFQVEKINACATLSFVNKVILLPYLEKVPGSPRHLAGLMNHAGQSIPVIDLAMYLQLNAEQTYTLATPIVICTMGSRQMGLIVKRVLGLSMMQADSLQMADQFGASHSPFIATIHLNSALTFLLNIPKLMSDHANIGDQEN